MVQRLAIVRALADGEFHSGQHLGAALGVSRAAIWKHVASLAELGLKVEAVRGRGYRLRQSIELLDVDTIRARLRPETAKMLTRLEVLSEIDSTNRYLLSVPARRSNHGAVCFAEYQHSGRGRRGRSWVSPFGSGLCLSIAWQFETGVESLAALSLAAGVGAIRALNRLGIRGAGLKWPNDLYVEDSKLAGILTEVRGEAGGPCTAVIGIGVNVALPPEVLPAIPQAVTDLRILLGHLPSRNRAAAALIDELMAMMSRFDGQGFSEFVDEWQSYDLLRNRNITVQLPNDTVSGIGAGIDRSGALLVKCTGGMQRFVAGEVSVRPAD